MQGPPSALALAHLLESVAVAPEVEVVPLQAWRDPSVREQHDPHCLLELVEAGDQQEYLGVDGVDVRFARSEVEEGPLSLPVESFIPVYESWPRKGLRTLPGGRVSCGRAGVGVRVGGSPVVRGEYRVPSPAASRG